MSPDLIYLDNNATTALDPEVAKTMLQAALRGPANASSQHALGQQTRALLDDVIERIGSTIGSPLNRPGGARLVFTSGGTEANNLAITGLGNRDGHLLVSSIEHPSVLAAAAFEEQQGRRVVYLDVDSDGLIRLDRLDAALDAAGPGTVVSIMSANNETGVIQPLQQIAEIIREKLALWHIDATQSFGKVPFDVEAVGAAAVTVTPHKFHGPTGIGALWLRSGVQLRPAFHGGQQQLGSRPGTEPVYLAVAMGEALDMAVGRLDVTAASMLRQREHLESELMGRFPEVIVHGSGANRLPNTSCLSFGSIDRQALLMALDLAGVACSSGSACTSGSSPPSHVLTAMRVPAESVRSAVRFGVSRMTTDDELQKAIEIISNCYKRLRR